MENKERTRSDLKKRKKRKRTKKKDNIDTDIYTQALHHSSATTTPYHHTYTHTLYTSIHNTHKTHKSRNLI